MVASSLLSDAAFVSDGSSYAVHQLVLLLGSAMTALNACVEAKEKEATWEVTTHHCLASLGFIAGFVPFLKDASILEDFCRYVMSVLPCVLEANLADEVLVKDVVLLMEKMSRFVDGEKRDDVMGEMESVVVEKKVLVSTELEKRCEEEEESDSSSYTYESYYSYETVSDEELPPSMPTLVSAPEKPAKEEKKPVEEEEDWGFEEEEKKDEDWGFDEKEEEKEEVKEPVEENVEVKKVEVKEDKKDKKKAEVNEEKKEEKPEEKKVKEEVKEEKKPVEEKKAEVKKEEEEKPEEKEEKPVEEKKKEPSADKNSTSTALARTEKKLEVDEHLWDDDDEPVKPARATRRGRKKEEVKEEKKAEVKKEEKEEEKPVAKPVEEAKPEVKKEEKPVEEKPEEKTEEKEEKKVEVKKEEEKKPSVDKNSTSTALARTEKKLEVDEHLWDDDDEPVKPARATRRGRKKEKAPVERVVIEPPLRSEKLFSDDEEEKKPKKTRRGRSGRSQALATFEASWDEEEVKPAEAKTEEKPVEEVKVEEKPVEEVKVEEKPVEKETKPAEKELKEEKVEKKEEKVEEKEKKEEESWDFASDGNDSSLEWSDQEQSATAPTPTNAPTTPTNTPTPTTPTNTPTPTTPTNTPTTPITIISSTTVASYTAVPDMMPLCTSPTTISPVLLQACRVLDLLLSSSLLLPACHCFQCYIPAVKKEPSLLCHFVDKLVRQIGAREMKEEEAKALTEIVTILVEDNECVTRAASDLVLELFLACQKKEEVSCIPKQLVLLVLSFYQQKREPWLITVFIHMFSTALSHHSMEQVTQCLVLLVATLQKLNAEDSQFLIAVCGMPIIDAILSVWSVMDKEALAALVPFAALLYGKTEKKEEIVELVLHLCGIALKRSIQLQPLNVKKCDEDADLVKVNSMIGELLFVMVRVNAESFKKGLQCLPAEKVSVIQEQLRHTIQVKQSETNAAKRRNASRMPVKLDASKFTNE